MSQDHTRLPPTSGEGQGRKARPILFSGPMVRALLAGSKTQTRRIVKGAPSEPEAEAVMVHGELCFGVRGNPGTTRETFNFTHGEEGERSSIRCPYGVPGDLLWVRETTRSRYLPNIFTGEPTNALCGEYVADGEPVLDPSEFDFAWWYSWPTCVAIHMPRFASRLTLEITEVRVERLNDISEADAIAEGLAPAPGGWWSAFGGSAAPTPAEAYALLWNHINGADGWAANPWVWAVSFKVHRQNVDALTQDIPPGGNSHEG